MIRAVFFCFYYAVKFLCLLYPTKPKIIIGKQIKIKIGQIIVASKYNIALANAGPFFLQKTAIQLSNTPNTNKTVCMHARTTNTVIISTTSEPEPKTSCTAFKYCMLSIPPLKRIFPKLIPINTAHIVAKTVETIKTLLLI